MALSRFTPWFAVSALNASWLLFNTLAPFRFPKYKCCVKAPPFIFIYPSFEVRAYVYPANNACLFAAPSTSRILSEISGRSNTTCVFSSNTEYYQQQRAQSQALRHSLGIVVWYFIFTHLNLNLVALPRVDNQRKAILTRLCISAEGVYKLRQNTCPDLWCLNFCSHRTSC